MDQQTHRLQRFAQGSLMSISSLPVHGDDPVAGWKVNPYLHFESEGIFNPHTDARLADDHRWYGRLLQLAADGKRAARVGR